MKKLLMYLFSLFSFLSSYSQTAFYNELNISNNEEKINICLKYANKYADTNTDTSKFFLIKGADISFKNGIESDSTAKIYYLLSKIYYNENNLDSASLYSDRSIKIAKKNSNNHLTARSLYVSGNIKYNYGKLFDATKLFGKAYKYAEIVKDSVLIADILIDKAYTHDILSEKDSALQMLEKASEISRKIHYSKGTGKAEIATGNIYYGIKDFKNALIHYKAALKAAEKIKSSIGTAASYKNIASVYLEEHNYNKALENLRLSLYEYKKLNSPIFLSNVYTDFAIIYSKTNKPDSVTYYLNKSIGISKRYGTDEDISIAYNVAGESYKNLKKFHLSNLYLDSCIRYAKKINYGLMLQESYKSYSENLFSLKNFKDAFSFYKRYNNIKDSVSNENFQKQLAQYQAKYETIQKEAEIERLKDKEMIDKANKRLLIIGIISVIIIFVLIIIRIQTRRKKDAEIQKQKILVHQKERELIKAKLEQKEIEEKRLKDEIEFKTKQLASHALNMMQKNKLLQELTENISQKTKTMSAEGRQELFSVKKQLEAGLNVDKDWDLFKIYFEQINESFFDKLKEINPKLTGNDYRLCALTKLNLSLKESASVLNISPESVKNARYRLKKKLNLNAEQDLNQFINNL